MHLPCGKPEILSLGSIGSRQEAFDSGIFFGNAFQRTIDRGTKLANVGDFLGAETVGR